MKRKRPDGVWTPKPGDPVRARFKADKAPPRYATRWEGQGFYFSGSICAVHSDGAADVHYNDGYFERRVLAKYLKRASHPVIRKWRTEGHELIGRRLARFDTMATITCWCPPSSPGSEFEWPLLFHCVHDDDDEEQLELAEVMKSLRPALPSSLQSSPEPANPGDVCGYGGGFNNGCSTSGDSGGERDRNPTNGESTVGSDGNDDRRNECGHSARDSPSRSAPSAASVQACAPAPTRRAAPSSSSTPSSGSSAAQTRMPPAPSTLGHPPGQSSSTALPPESLFVHARGTAPAAAPAATPAATPAAAPARGAGGASSLHGMDAVRFVLTRLHLERYSHVFEEQGFDDLGHLHKLAVEQGGMDGPAWQHLCRHTQLKPGHANKLAMMLPAAAAELLGLPRMQMQHGSGT